MVRIQYSNSRSGLRNCFSFLFPMEKYIPSRYFESNDESSPELHYFIDLLRDGNMFDNNDEHCHVSIWSHHYDCMYKQELPFTMVYDDDYGIVSFAVRETSMNCLEELAETLSNMIERNQM